MRNEEGKELIIFSLQLTPVGLTVFRLISTNDLDEGDNKQVEYLLERSPTAQVKFTSNIDQ